MCRARRTVRRAKTRVVQSLSQLAAHPTAEPALQAQCTAALSVIATACGLMCLDDSDSDDEGRKENVKGKEQVAAQAPVASALPGEALRSRTCSPQVVSPGAADAGGAAHDTSHASDAAHSAAKPAAADGIDVSSLLRMTDAGAAVSMVNDVAAQLAAYQTSGAVSAELLDEKLIRDLQTLAQYLSALQGSRPQQQQQQQPPKQGTEAAAPQGQGCGRGSRRSAAGPVRQGRRSRSMASRS